mmetsp:Transcript_17876/g.25892  ORF Transcript_17876/g.25892 Transcript_17876/m.25892 type:complete len:944 (+) Transcript_17876:281-3112(+)
MESSEPSYLTPCSKEGKMNKSLKFPSVKAVAISTTIICIILLKPFMADANMPPYPFQYTINLPNGRESPPLRMLGDAHYHWEETDDGFTVIDDPDGSGYLMIAERDETTGKLCSSGIKVGEGNPQKRGIQKHINPTSEAVRAECGAFCEADEYGNPPASTMGNGSRRHRNMRQLSLEEQNNRRDLIATANKLKNLVILIRFSDHQDRNLPSESQYDELFNGSGPSASAPTGSVNDVYLQSSHGSLAIESTVYPWITLSKPEIYYADGRNGFTGKFFEAIHEALDVIDNDPTINIADFNTDYDKGDRFIDAITFLHSGYGAEFSSTDCYGRRSTDRIWSHKWAMYFGKGQWESKDRRVKVYNYHVSPGLYGTCNSNIGRIGVIAHEMGHFLGLPDLYDGTPSGGKGIGSWGLMSNSWGFDGSQKYPPIMSAWSKVKLGWVEPKVITRSGQYAIQASYEQPDVYKVEAGYPDGEYLLIENRQAGGFDFKVPSGGLAIWHIDESADNNSGYPGQSEWPLNGRHYAVSLVQADGRYDLERGRGSGDAGDLFRGGGISLLGPSEGDVLAGPFPNTDSYQGGNIQKTGNRISNISPSSETMTFSFTSPLLPTYDPTKSPTKAPTPRPTQTPTPRPTPFPTKAPTSSPTHLSSEMPSLIPSSMPSSRPSSLPPVLPPSVLFEIEECRGYLLEADKSPANGHVDMNEYTEFISLWTAGQIQADNFLNLPGDLQWEFRFESKYIDDTLLIPTTDATSADRSYLYETCGKIKKAIDEILPPSQGNDGESLITDSMPSSMPSSQPSVMPSLMPSSMPSSQPSAMPSLVSSSMPSYQPSVMPSHDPSFTPSSQPSSIPSLATTSPPLSDFELCKNYLRQADTSSPAGKVDANEYTKFISFLSDGRINKTRFRDLPFNLIILFTFDSQNNYIPLAEETAADTAYLTKICSKTKSAI